MPYRNAPPQAACHRLRRLHRFNRLCPEKQQDEPGNLLLEGSSESLTLQSQGGRKLAWRQELNCISSGNLNFGSLNAMSLPASRSLLSKGERTFAPSKPAKAQTIRYVLPYNLISYAHAARNPR